MTFPRLCLDNRNNHLSRFGRVHERTRPAHISNFTSIVCQSATRRPRSPLHPSRVLRRERARAMEQCNKNEWVPGLLGAEVCQRRESSRGFPRRGDMQTSNYWWVSTSRHRETRPRIDRESRSSTSHKRLRIASPLASETPTTTTFPATTPYLQPACKHPTSSTPLTSHIYPLPSPAERCLGACPCTSEKLNETLHSRTRSRSGLACAGKRCIANAQRVP